MLGVGHAETPELFQFSVAPSGSRNCRGSGRRPFPTPPDPSRDPKPVGTTGRRGGRADGEKPPSSQPLEPDQC